MRRCRTKTEQSRFSQETGLLFLFTEYVDDPVMPGRTV